MDAGKTVVRVGLLAGFAMLVGGLYVFYKQQMYYAMQYCYKIHKFFPKTFTKDLLEFDMIIKVLNRSSFMVIAKHYKLDVYLDNTFLTSISSDKENVIQPNNVSQLLVNIKVTPSQMFKSINLANLIKNYLTDKSKIKVKVSGYIGIKANFVNIKNMPINYESNLAELMTPGDPANESDRLMCPDF
jgi:LEA14-like dessication related protein